MEISRRCENCNFYVHRASMQNNSEIKALLDKEKQIGMIQPERLFEEEQAPIKKTMKKQKTLKH